MKRVTLLIFVILIFQPVVGADKTIDISDSEPFDNLVEIDEIRVKQPYLRDNLSNPIDPYTSVVLANNLGLSLVFDTLISFNPYNSKYEAQLAKDWFVSNNSLEWIFQLRDDVYFHSGKQLNSSDIYFTFYRLLNQSDPRALTPQESFVFYPLIENIKEIIIVDEFEIKFLLKEPYAPFLSELTAFFILHEANFDGTSFSNLIGTGPYIFDTNTSNTTNEIFLRNSNYFKPLPRIGKIISIPFATNIDNILNNNLADIIPFVSRNTTNTDWNFEIEDIFHSGYFGVYNFNDQIMSDTNVRKAFSHTINQSRLVQQFKHPSVNSDVNQVRTSIFYNDEYKNPASDFDNEYANEILDSSGFPKDRNGIRFTIDLAFQLKNEYITALIIEDFESIGIEVNLVQIQNLEELEETDFDIFIIALSSIGGIDPADAVSIIETNHPFNLGNYTSEEVDDLIKLGLSTPIENQRSVYYHQINEIVESDIPHLELINIRLGHLFKTEYDNYVSITYDVKFNFNDFEINPINQFEYKSSNHNIDGNNLYFWNLAVLISETDEFSNFNINKSQIDDGSETEIEMEISTNSTSTYRLDVFLDHNLASNFIITSNQDVLINGIDYEYNEVTRSIIILSSGNFNFEILVSPGLEEEHSSPNYSLFSITVLLFCLIIPFSLLMIGSDIRRGMNNRNLLRIFLIFNPNRKYRLIYLSVHVFVILGIFYLLFLRGLM